MRNKFGCRLLLCIGMFGCQANEDSLTEYVGQVTFDSHKSIVPPNPRVPVEAFIYENTSSRQPFELPREAETQSQAVENKECNQPVTRIAKDPLEQFALSQLNFKGVISNGKSISALIQTTDGKLFYAEQGQYIGLNHGKITQISQSNLLISESIVDGSGCWQHRREKLALQQREHIDG
ncbi:pilus assembly protein PilP [Vibrio ziniensis]|uniref:Pilus assembly protein PilP n=1 Tax=Vibrio ziniensis TaxID=2711221 RepID=A0A6G7CF29_9VIBR|nr:pilus assembly protein PilP [Vibrio ziniensis]QIH40673.1 pilus assembly protein PilP [Vibrio ziniensis]